MNEGEVTVGAKERRIGFEVTQGPDGWIKVRKGVFPVFGVSGRKRLLFRVSEDSEGIVVIDHRLDGVLTLHDPLLVFAGQQCKIEEIAVDSMT